MKLFNFIRKRLLQGEAVSAPPIRENFSDVPVDEGRALSLSTVWACVRIVSESIASLPIGVYVKGDQDNRIPQKDNTLYGLLHNSPNADMVPFDFIQVLVASQLLWGVGYVLKTRRRDGTLISLEPLNPAFVTKEQQANDRISYVYTDPDKGIRQRFSEDRISVLPAFTLDGKSGLSAIRYGMNNFANALAMEESVGRIYKNGMRPASSFIFPDFLKDNQRESVRKSLVAQFAGVQNTGKPLVLEGGLKYEDLTIHPADLQMLESKSFSVAEICRWFGVPPTLIGHTEKSTTWGTGLEQINLFFLTYCLQPHVTRMQQRFNKEFLTAKDRAGGVYTEFKLDAFMRADSTGRAALYSSASQNGWMTRAEIRRKENLPFIEGSDDLTVQSALVPLKDLGRVVDDAVKSAVEKQLPDFDGAGFNGNDKE